MEHLGWVLTKDFSENARNKARLAEVCEFRIFQNK
jgi:hypothetical protein